MSKRENKCRRTMVHDPHGECSGVRQEQLDKKDHVLVTIARLNGREVVNVYGPYSRKEALQEARLERREFQKNWMGAGSSLYAAPHLIINIEEMNSGADPENQGDAGPTGATQQGSPATGLESH